MTHTIKDYLVSAIESVEEKLKFCDTHKDQTVSFGCAKCWNIYCLGCLSSVSSCANGGEQFYPKCSNTEHYSSDNMIYVFLTNVEIVCHKN